MCRWNRTIGGSPKGLLRCPCVEGEAETLRCLSEAGLWWWGIGRACFGGICEAALRGMDRGGRSGRCEGYGQGRWPFGADEQDPCCCGGAGRGLSTTWNRGSNLVPGCRLCRARADAWSSRHCQKRPGASLGPTRWTECLVFRAFAHPLFRARGNIWAVVPPGTGAGQVCEADGRLSAQGHCGIHRRDIQSELCDSQLAPLSRE
mmetsp:Transcript_175127/g.561627  ORF Transcript_175127/g.561627 Transcript_175127/m.561627 type:complete len:204 (+) Transcript_175127:254-865(+)